MTSKSILTRRVDTISSALSAQVGDEDILRRYPRISHAYSVDSRGVLFPVRKGKMSRKLDNLLVTAARVGNLDEVKRLVSEGANVRVYNNLPLVNASKEGHHDVVRYLLLQGANDTFGDALVSAARGGHPQIVVSILATGVISTAINRAVAEAILFGNPSVVMYLVSKGADVNADGGDALISTARTGDLFMLALLDSVGGNIHAKNDQAFIEASQRGHLDVVKYLVTRGVDIHTRNDLAFIDASNRNHVCVVLFLISKGVNVHVRNDLAFREAAKYPHLGMIPLFLDVGDYRRFNFPPNVREYIEQEESKKAVIRDSLSLGPVLAAMVSDYY